MWSKVLLAVASVVEWGFGPSFYLLVRSSSSLLPAENKEQNCNPLQINGDLGPVGVHHTERRILRLSLSPEGLAGTATTCARALH